MAPFGTHTVESKPAAFAAAPPLPACPQPPADQGDSHLLSRLHEIIGPAQPDCAVPAHHPHAQWRNSWL